MIQEISLTLTPHAGGAALVLPAGELEQDALGNLTVRWVDAVYQGRLLRASDLLGYLSSNVEVHRNRLGTVVAVTDPGGLLLEAQWTEYDPWAGVPSGPHHLRCVMTLAGQSSLASEGRVSVVLYRAVARFERGTGLLEGP